MSEANCWREAETNELRPCYSRSSGTRRGAAEPLLPRTPIRNLVCVVRLDELPNGHELRRCPLCGLYALYQHLQRRGKLPPRWAPPKKAGAADDRQQGEGALRG